MTIIISGHAYLVSGFPLSGVESMSCFFLHLVTFKKNICTSCIGHFLNIYLDSRSLFNFNLFILFYFCMYLIYVTVFVISMVQHIYK